MFSTVVRLTPTSPATYRAERPDWYSSTTRWRTRLVARRFVMTGLPVVRAAGGRSSTGVLGVYCARASGKNKDLRKVILPNPPMTMDGIFYLINIIAQKYKVIITC